MSKTSLSIVCVLTIAGVAIWAVFWRNRLDPADPETKSSDSAEPRSGSRDPSEAADRPHRSEDRSADDSGPGAESAGPEGPGAPGAAADDEVRVVDLGELGHPDDPGADPAAAPHYVPLRESFGGEVLSEEEITLIARTTLEAAFREKAADPGESSQPGPEPLQVALEVEGTIPAPDGVDVLVRASISDASVLLSVRVDPLTGRVLAQESAAPRHQVPRADPDVARATGSARGFGAKTDVVLAYDPPNQRLVWRVRGPGQASEENLGKVVGVLVDLETGEVLAEEVVGRASSDQTRFEVQPRYVHELWGGGEEEKE